MHKALAKKGPVGRVGSRAGISRTGLAWRLTQAPYKATFGEAASAAGKVKKGKSALTRHTFPGIFSALHEKEAKCPEFAVLQERSRPGAT